LTDFREGAEKGPNIKFLQNPVETELRHAERERERDGPTDGEIDMTKLIVAFRNTAFPPKNLL
jgi:hypothetical protein